MELKDQTILAIGMVSLVLGIFLQRFSLGEYAGFYFFDFFEGALFGLSFVMNLFYLTQLSRKQNIRS